MPVVWRLDQGENNHERGRTKWTIIHRIVFGSGVFGLRQYVWKDPKAKVARFTSRGNKYVTPIECKNIQKQYTESIMRGASMVHSA